MGKESDSPTKSAEASNPAPNIRASDQEISGVSDELFADELLIQVFKSLFFPPNTKQQDMERAAAAAVTFLKEFAPQNAVEGLLAAQMVVTHNGAMECLRRAALTNQTFEGRNMALTHAQKLLRLYLEQVKTLNKQRGKGDQKMVIEHVNVAPGAQAIVGNVEMTEKQRKKLTPQQMGNTLVMEGEPAIESAEVPAGNAKRKK